jgi:superfamily II DNA or RNA helicase
VLRAERRQWAAGLQPQAGGPPLLVVVTGSYAGEGFDCPALDTLFLAAPVANKGSLTQYVSRILRSHENKTTAEVHDYLDQRTGVLAAMLPSVRPVTPILGFRILARSASLQALARTTDRVRESSDITSA